MTVEPPDSLPADTLSCPLSPEDHAVLMESLVAQKPQMEDQITQSITRCREIFSSFSPILLLWALANEWAFTKVNTETGEKEEAKETLLEYALSLSTAIPGPISGNAPTMAVVNELTELIKIIHETTSLYYTIESADSANLTDERLIQSKQKISALHHRGRGFKNHRMAMFKSMFKEHDEYFRRRFGISASEMIDIVFVFSNQPMDGIQSFGVVTSNLKAAIDLMSQSPEIQKMIESSNEEIMQKAQSMPKLKGVISRLKESTVILNTNPFELKLNSSNELIVAKLLSIRLGDNIQFLDTPKWAGWPLNPTSVLLHPLISHEGMFYAYQPQILWSNLDKILFALIENDSAYRNTFVKAKGKWLEKEALRLLADRLKHAVIYHQLFYDVQIDGKTVQMEVDGVLLFDGHVMVLSAKSGQVSDSARRGGTQRMTSTYDKLVAGGFTQIIRARDYIYAHPEGALFYNKKGNTVTIMPPNLGRLFLPINVTLDDLGPVAMQLGALKRAGILRSDEYLWTVGIHDLRIITEIIESPSLLLLYWTRRIRSYDFSGFAPFEEMDVLMYYLSYGLFFEDGLIQDDKQLTVHMTASLDAYFCSQAAGESAVKPHMNLHAGMQSLLEILEKCPMPGFTSVCMFLFGASGNMQGTILTMIENITQRQLIDQKPHQLTAYFPDFDTGINVACISEADQAAMDKMMQFSFLKKYETRYANWHTIIIEFKGNKIIRAYTHTATQPWELNPMMEPIMAQLKLDRAKKKFPRNNPCPCGRPRKYKDCCGR